MNEVIRTKHDLCTGCNRCVRECPMEMANTTYQESDGSIKVRVNYEKCISCGRCFSVCNHDARYYTDDTDRFFEDLAKGKSISLIAAPSIRTNIPDYKKLFTCLKQLGVKKIYDVSLGADICIWAHVRLLEKSTPPPLITQPCPPIVRFCEIYRHDLLKNLSPVHSPMGCVSVYMKEYEGITDMIAALSPCIAKSNEFAGTGLAQYNVTFVKLLEYLKKNNISLPGEETGFDHAESGLGFLFPMSGGLQANIQFFMGDKFNIDREEGREVYKRLNVYALTPKEMLPHVFDVLNCHDGCNVSASSISAGSRPQAVNIFEINHVMNKQKYAMLKKRDREYFESVFKSYDDRLNISHFLRNYKPISAPQVQITEEDINNAFKLLGKSEHRKQHINCGACGSETCHGMARKIALDVNIPVNCIVKTMEDARYEHTEKLATFEKMTTLEKMHEADERLAKALELNELQLTKLNLMVKATKIGLWDMEVIKNDPVNPLNTFNWSDEFRHMLGFFDVDDFPNQLCSWSERLHPDDKIRTLEIFKKHIEDNSGKTPYDIEYRLLKNNGEYGYFRASGETIRDEDGNPIRVAGALMDITETKNILFNTERQKIEAEAANRAKSAFLSTMSHEIRTPMNAILGVTAIQLQNQAIDESIKESFEKIYASGGMLLGIINDILDLSKIESGKLELVNANYEIASLISDSTQFNIMRIGYKPIDFVLEINEDMPLRLLGDELRVKQILNNLLSNAFKYTIAGSVKLSVAAESGHDEKTITLVFCVSDTGVGMTKEQVEKLFDEYSRFNLEANRTTEGTGLGMSITRNLLRLMNGEIFVQSEPGKGSQFTVRLPQGRVGTEVLGKEMAENLRQFRICSKERLKKVQITREPMPYGSVLVVDDVETNIYVARGLLAPYELKIDSVDSGLAAIKKIIAGNVYDIIFMDHMMPKMDGIEAALTLRAIGYDRPIVALTANAVAGQAEVFLENGFDDYILKPLDVRHLDNVLNRLISKKHKTQEAGSNSRPPLSGGALEFAEIFVRDTLKTIAELELIIQKQQPCSEEDLRVYIIRVHGIKSALAAIGKTELSAIARKLEMAARAGDTETIFSETKAFINLLRAVVAEFKRQEEAAVCEAAEGDSNLLREKLLEIKTACSAYDEKTANDILTELRKNKWPAAVNELLQTIVRHLLHSEFEEIAELIDNCSQLS